MLILAELNFFQEEFEAVNPNYIWLNFINMSDSPSKIFNESYVPYNCENLLVKTDFKTRFDIVEIYHNHIKDLQLFEIKYGIWSRKEGLNVSDEEFYKRRINLKGTNFTFAIAQKVL